MTGKVVHVPDDIHARAKSHCEKNGVSMREFIGELIEEAMKSPVALIPPLREPKPEVRVIENEGTPIPTEVKKKLEIVPDPCDAVVDALMERPPFWADKE